MNGIDISSHNGNINYNMLKNTYNKVKQLYAKDIWKYEICISKSRILV